MRTAAATWRIFSLPRYTIAILVSVELLAALVPWTNSASITPDKLGVALLLASLSIAYSVSTVTFERVRVLLAKGTSPSMCPNLLATWTFAAAVMLPMRLAAVVVVVAVVADWPARNVASQTHLYKYVYSSASAMLAMATANQVVATVTLPCGSEFLLAGVGYMAVGAGLVALAMITAGQAAQLGIFLKPRTHVIEVCTIGIGMAEALLNTVNLPLSWLSLPAAIAIQQWSGRAALRKASELPEPMSEGVWVHVARGLVAGCKLAAVLRVDTDDPVALRALTTTVQTGCDAVGQYAAGLAILLVDCPDPNAEALALRLRAALVDTCPTAKVAVAASPRDGDCLEDLLVVTEAELTAAGAAPSSRLPDQR